MKEFRELGAPRSRLRRPQVLRDPSEENRTSTWLELFFDLCFVVAVAALARGLHNDPTLGGALRFAGLFVPVWWSWMIFTWYATAFDNDDVPYRATLLTAMLFTLWLAASIGEVGFGSSTSFVLAYVALRLLLVGLYARAHYHATPAIRGFTALYAAGNGVGAGIWLASLLVPEPARYGVWALGLLVELLGPILATNTLADLRVSFHPEHIPERYGLFTIIVLGEAVLAVAAGTADTGWDLSAVLTGVSGFVIAACIWWLYFDYVGSSALGTSTGFHWGYGHLLVYASIATVGVGTQLAIEGAAPTAELASVAPAAVGTEGSLSGGARGILGGGAAVYLAAIGFIHWVNLQSLDDRVLAARIVAAVALICLTFFGWLLSPLAFTALVAGTLLALTTSETLYAARSPSGKTAA